ncbi:unnamed protein product [Cuscuta epithymum]|uniref:GAG-pre-integrase domain-containing protein n=1 Tax=Cuscuta epithymum TaxID=186058 RepID=A0AAV0DIW2_9ASTE|nr:unnamed protein product [Cuscuta epithymum]
MANPLISAESLRALAFTDDQWKAFVQLVNQCKAPPHDKLAGKNLNTTAWLLDSGASLHMTGQESILTNIHKIPPMPIFLPNGEVTHATSKGDVQLSRAIKMTNVLLVPGLTCNLISLAQLIDEQKCGIFFANDICVIQDLLSRTPIGAGEKRGGVYYFHSLDPVRACSITEEQSDLWHSRLGHPSVKVLRSVINFNNTLSDRCCSK